MPFAYPARAPSVLAFVYPSRSWHHARMSFASYRPGRVFAPVALLLFASQTAYATSTMEIVGATTGGNQNTARVLSHSSAATYFNPSLLPEATPKLEIGLFGLASRGRIRLRSRPAGVDVPSSIYTSNSPLRPLATVDLPNPRSDTEEDNNIMYVAIGMVRPTSPAVVAVARVLIEPSNV